MKNAATGHDADAAHYAYEVLGAPAVCWTDQIYTRSHIAYGCRHYPRGVTSALWWLWPSAHPAPARCRHRETAGHRLTRAQCFGAP